MKPVVYYRGGCELITYHLPPQFQFAILWEVEDHPVLGKCESVRTGMIVSYNEETGRVETLNTIYLPKEEINHMKFAIKNRWTGNVQITAEIECNRNTPASIKLGLAIKWALKSGADLSGADLSGADLIGADLNRADLNRADLRGADLSEAYLSGADLSEADLRGADLSEACLIGANLRGADLNRADLRRADLSGADLSGADLSEAYLIGDIKILPGRSFLQLGPIGSRNDWMMAFRTTKGLYVCTGCFFGPISDFGVAVTKTHGDGEHGQHYRAAIKMVRTMWPDKGE